MSKIKKFFSFFKIAPQDILIAIIAVFATLSFIAVFTYLYFSADLQSKDKIMNRNNTGVILLDKNGEVFFRFYEASYRQFVPIEQIPKDIQYAAIAAEDKDFYHHPGFSVKAIGGALLADLKDGGSSFGGSTITQQLVKNSLLNPNKNFLRKFQEVILAQEIERKYSKDEILEMYLNSVYFGEGAFGIEGASQTYFGKGASELDLAQSALLAGIITAPSKFSPISGDLDQAKQRQTYVLSQMAQENFITEDQKSQALNEELTFTPGQDLIPYKAPHFALMVKKELEDKYGEEEIARSGFVIKTSIDLKTQSLAERVVADQVAKLKRDIVSNGAAVIIDPKNGEVLSLVGSKDWNDPEFGKVNIPTFTRQPGSSFKPIIYAAALEKKLITPATILEDKKTTFGGQFDEPYTPKNYDGKFRGNVTVRRALANSLNIPAVEVMQKLGVKEGVDAAKNLGITQLKEPSDYGLSFVLGSADVRLIDMTNAYAAFANYGEQYDLTTILQIQDKQGKTIYDYNPKPHQVLTPETAFLISSILSDQSTRSEEFGTSLANTKNAAVKTGTTEDYRDSLTIGYTPSIVIGVWVGNNDGTPMDKVAGSLGAAPIWKQLIEQLAPSGEKFDQPAGVSQISICKSNGLRIREATSSAFREYFLRGTEPKAYCTNPNPSPTPNVSDQPANTPQPDATPNPTPVPTSDTQPNVQDNNFQINIPRNNQGGQDLDINL